MVEAWGSAEAEEGMGSEEILKEPTGFAAGGDVRWERKRNIQVDSRIWD